MLQEKPENKKAGATVTAQSRVGVLLVALGTPAGLTKKDIRAFLREFLADRRVVDLPAALWLPILYGPVSLFRPGKALRNYSEIWNYEEDASPLRVITRAQASELAKRLGTSACVEWAFTYGKPSVAGSIDRLRAQGCDHILAVPLYPQYSVTTTAAAMDKVHAALGQLHETLQLRSVRSWHRQPAYIGALAETVNDSLAELDWQPERIVASYHGIPEKGYRAGDPYPDEAYETTALLAAALDRPETDFETVFQSRFGAAEWVKPYTDERVEELARQGVKKIAVLAPAFLADCLESLEELNISLRKSFLEAGGTHFHYIPCLNADAPGINALEIIVREELEGWL